jgi:hypothetical protein
MPLQPFVGPWPLLGFLDLLNSRQDPLDEGSARRRAASYLHTHFSTNTEQTHTDTHA